MSTALPKMERVSFNRRLFAAILDMIIISFVFFPVMNLMNFLIHGDRTIEAIIAELSKSSENIDPILLMDTLYQENYFLKYFMSQIALFMMVGIYVVFFWRNYGATPGKFLLCCRVINESGEVKLSITQCILRYIGYVVSAIPFFIGFFMIEFSKEKKGLHDKLSGTIVVADKKVISLLRQFKGFMRKNKNSQVS